MAEILTTVEKVEKEYGPNSIFLICADYHGKYEDDYCYFTYFNNVTGEAESDYWTTAAACPSYGRYECMTVKEAMEKGLLDMNKWNDYKIAGYRKCLYNEKTSEYMIKDKHHPIVEVKGGRKWKGIGILASVNTSSYSWGPTYGRGYNTSVTETAVIYSFEECCLRECNNDFVKVVEPQKLFTQYNEWANAMIDTAAEKTGRDAERMKKDWDWSFDAFMKERFESLHIDVDNAFYPEQIERAKKNAEKKAETLASIREWVKNNTDKTEIAEIEGLVMGIYRKRYC